MLKQELSTVKTQPSFYMKGQEILDADIKIPGNWGEGCNLKRDKMTRTRLIQQRIKARQPDPSFDIDGDGVISSRDFFISLRFDKDKDGKLNAEEKAACLKALKDDNFEDNFLFGLDANVPINDNKDPDLLKIRVRQ